jgi:hypothetical protein
MVTSASALIHHIPQETTLGFMSSYYFYYAILFPGLAVEERTLVTEEIVADRCPSYTPIIYKLVYYST